MEKIKQPFETCFNYCYEKNKNDYIGWFSSNEQRWINRARQLAEEYPDEVVIRKEPDENDGCIYIKVPQKWLKIVPPRKINMTEEQRMERRERAKRNFSK